ncbi:RNA-binding cell elongation regulator Jag/EloR [Fimbriimonas ginsengisoli]|nr:RNA-binding cell elongation regulator Jag/EloR [Fimbriimonas ginsengisoli]
MQTVEISAKSVQDATKQAADKLGVSPDQVRVTVLEETKGLFGKSTVRVRAEVIEAAPAPVATAPAAAAPAAPKGGRGKKAAPAPEPTPQVVIEEVQATAVSAPVEAPKEPARRGRGKKAEPEAPAPVVEPAESEATETEVLASQSDADTLLLLVRELLDAAQLTVTAKIGSISGKYVNITLDGKDVAFIVGKHGEVLNAFQYLVNIVASRRIERGVRATIDGNDYRRRREEALTQLAQKIAEQVQKRGEEAVLDALPAFERRIVHKALGEISGITTYSEGEEPNRRVVIAPAD